MFCDFIVTQLVVKHQSQVKLLRHVARGTRAQSVFSRHVLFMDKHASCFV